MTRYIVMLLVFVGLAGVVPHYFDAYGGGSGQAPAHAGQAGKRVQAISAPDRHGLPEANYLGNGRVATLKPNRQGHFTGSFRINGQTVVGIIDTGATYVALNESTARQLGIDPPPSAFKYKVETANGTTKAAHAVLSSVEIGQVRVDNVEAFILSDSSMSETLIGMSFMKKLRSYRVRDGVLEIKN